jgi:hypothetical protein
MVWLAVVLIWVRLSLIVGGGLLLHGVTTPSSFSSLAGFAIISTSLALEVLRGVAWHVQLIAQKHYGDEPLPPC